jgi:hypothetical protein
MPGERLSIYVRNCPFSATEMGLHFHMVGITVNNTTEIADFRGLSPHCFYTVRPEGGR